LRPATAHREPLALLHARDAFTHGSTIRYEPQPNKNTIGYWTKLDDWVSWDFLVDQPGIYEAEILQGCGKGSGGSEVEFSIAAQTLKVTVQDSSGFTNSLALANGQAVNLENYNLAQLTIWHWLGFAIGGAWVLYWTVTRPTVTRLAVTTQIPLNSDGLEFGLVTRKDHRVANWFAIGTPANPPN